MLKRVKVYLVLSLVALATSFVGAVGVSASVDAAAPPLLQNNAVYKNISAHQHYWWLHGCFATSDIDNTTRSEVDDWDFFQGGAGNPQVLGAMYGPGGSGEDVPGFRSCNSEGVIKTAFGYLGFNNSRDTFCSINGRQYDGNNVDKTTCVAGPGDGTWDNNADKSVRAKWFRDNALSKKPALRPEGEYLRSYLSLMEGCNISVINKKLYTSASSVAQVDDDNKYAVPVVIEVKSGNKSSFEVRYVQGIGDKSSNSRTAYVATSTGGITFKSCNALAATARDNVNAYRAVLATSGYDDKISSGAASNTQDGENNETTSCAVDGIGWILCPVVNFLGSITDRLYDVLRELLVVEAGKIFDTSGVTYQAWSMMRNIANVAFVIAFLFIIYSQMTGVGVTNYGIKKLLPKIIVSAVLVNISFWLCAVAVDVSNIAGTSLKGFMDPSEQTLAFKISEEGFTATGNGWSELGVVILASSVIVYLGLSVLLPALIVVLFAVVTVVAVLAMRQALIILLIVIAPLAFVAYMLPNTEEWFKKWLNLFKILLLMFPIIALIFSASALASVVVMGSSNSVIVQVMGALITAVPLFVTPIVMKTAGGVLNRFGGIVNNVDKGPFDRMKKGAAGVRERELTRKNNSAYGRNFSVRGGLLRRNARRDAIQNAQQAALKDKTTGYIASKALENDGNNSFVNKMAKGGGDAAKASVIASALSQEKKAFAEDVSNMEALVKVRYKDPQAALDEALSKGDRTTAVAAENLLIRSGGSGVSKVRDSIERAENAGLLPSGADGGDSEVVKAMKENITQNHGQYVKSKGADMVKWAGTSGANLSTTGAGALSDNDLASQHVASIAKLIQQNSVSTEQATRMLSDPRVSANLDIEQKKLLQKLTTPINQSSSPPTSSGPSPYL